LPHLLSKTNFSNPQSSFSKMKKFYTLFFALCFATVASAQVPKLVNYQGVARDANNQPKANQAITLKLSVLDNIAATTPIYSEIMPVTTNAMGLFTVKIGSGTPVIGTINTVNWAEGTKYLKTEIDLNGGNTFTNAGLPVQFVAVPYALVADTALRAPRASIAGVVAGGELSGTYPDPRVAKLINYPLATTAPTSGQVLGFNGTQWMPTTPATGGTNYTAGTGIAINNGVITNSAPNQTVSLTGSNGVNVTGTYPNFAITGSSSSGGQIIVMNTANAGTLTLTAPSIVQVEGTITFSATNSRLTSSEKHQVFGGTFQGSGSPTVNIGAYTRFYGVTFNDISLNGSDLIFESCTFSGNIGQLPWEATFINCNFTNATIGSVTRLGRLIKCKIATCTIPRLIGISQSTITGSTLGSGSINATNLEYLTDNYINGSSIYFLQSNGLVSGNQVSNTKFQIGSSSIAPNILNISNNVFDYGGTDAIINFDVSYAGYKNYKISNNQFALGNTALSGIKIQNNDGNSLGYSIIAINDNQFYNSSQSAILNNSSNTKLVVTNNITQRITLGVTDNGSNVRLANNFNF
jgi:hypothetical protein